MDVPPTESVERQGGTGASPVANYIPKWITSKRFGTAVLALPFVLFIYRHVWHDVIVIEPFQVPPSLVDQGYTPETFANRVGDQLRRIAAHVQRNVDNVSSGSDEDAIPDVEIPGTSLNLKTVVEILQDSFGISVQRVGGDVTIATATDPGTSTRQYLLTTSYTYKRTRHLTQLSVPAEDVEALAYQAAEMILQEVNPALYAMHKLREGQYDETMAFVYQELEDPTASRLGKVSALNLWGSVLAAERKYDDAAARYGEAIILAPDNAAAYSDLGIIRHAQHRDIEASSLYQYAIWLDSSDTLAYNNWGVLERASGNYTAAVRHYRKALALDPNNALAYLNWGNILMAQGRLDEAIASFRKAADLDPDYTLAFDHWANAVAAQGNVETAITLYKKAIAADPRNPAAYSDLGISLAKENKDDEAIAMYRKAIAADPSYANAYINWGDLLKQEGKTEEAESKYREARALSASP